MSLPTWIAVPKKEISERLMDFQHFLFCFSLVLFADTYLLVLYRMDIREIDLGWISSHLTAQTALAFLGTLFFFYSTLIPGIQIVGRFFAGLFSKHHYLRDEGYVSLDELTKFSMSHNNAVIYQEVQSKIKQNRMMAHFHAICIALVILSIAGYVLGNPAHEGLVQFLYYQIEAMPWYLDWPLKAITAPPMFGVLLMAFAFRNSDANYMYIREFEKWGPDKAIH